MGKEALIKELRKQIREAQTALNKRITESAALSAQENSDKASVAVAEAHVKVCGHIPLHC
jgi:hypothetical protein